MSYSLKKTYDSFCVEIEELDRIMSKLAMNPPTVERDTHVEGCFLRLVVKWENFSEEYFLRCMCGGKTRSSRQLIKPNGQLFRTTHDAYKRLHQKGAARERDYLDWLTTNTIEKRLNDFFRKNSRTQDLLLESGVFNELKVIRNAIAHQSVSSMEKVRKIALTRIGIVPTTSASISELILSHDKKTHRTLYHRTSHHLFQLAGRLTH